MIGIYVDIDVKTDLGFSIGLITLLLYVIYFSYCIIKNGHL